MDDPKKAPGGLTDASFPDLTTGEQPSFPPMAHAPPPRSLRNRSSTMARGRQRSRASASPSVVNSQPTIEWYETGIPVAAADTTNVTVADTEPVVPRRTRSRSTRSSRAQPSSGVLETEQHNDHIRPPDPSIRSQIITDFSPMGFGNFEDRDDELDGELEQALLYSRESFLEEQRGRVRTLQRQRLIATENDSTLRSVRSRISWRIRFAGNNRDYELWSVLAHFIDRLRSLNDAGHDVSSIISLDDVRNASRSMDVIPEPEMNQYRQLGGIIQQVQETVNASTPSFLRAFDVAQPNL